MATSFKMSCACTATLSALAMQQATANPRLCRRLLDTHKRHSPSLLAHLSPRPVCMPQQQHPVESCPWTELPEAATLQGRLSYFKS